jgi:hypothetical protein
MTHLSSITFNQLFQLVILVIAIALAFLIVRYFFHIVAHIFHFLTNFLWHGCLIIVALAIVLGIVRYLKIF